jgi:hypothetical protein
MRNRETQAFDWQREIINRFQIRELSWNKEADGTTRTFLNNISNALDKNTAEKIHVASRAKLDPTTRKYEEKRLREILRREIAYEFIQNNDRTDIYLDRFRTK